MYNTDLTCLPVGIDRVILWIQNNILNKVQQYIISVLTNNIAVFRDILTYI